jgi:hypothetical protein
MYGIEIRDCSVNVSETHLEDQLESSSPMFIHDRNEEEKGSDATAASHTSVGFCCGGPEGVVRGTVVNCRLQCCQIGILTRDASAMEFVSCRISDCSDAGIVSRDGSSSIIKQCFVARSVIGVVLQGIMRGFVDAMTLDACGVGVLVHKMGNGSVQNANARDCGRGFVIAKGAGGLNYKNISVKGGNCGVVVGSVCDLSGFKVESCCDEGFLVERSGRTVLQVLNIPCLFIFDHLTLQWQDCIAIDCGKGCYVLGDITCHNCEWTRCGIGFERCDFLSSLFVCSCL